MATGSQALLWFVFFLSGISGISYELIWVRYVGRVVGGSTPAISATVAVFLGGLALGSLIASRLLGRARRPLVTYAAIEVAIAIQAVLVPQAFAATEMLSASAAMAVLALPTLTLGATFPAMARVVAALPNQVNATARYYGFNTLGGVAGCVLASFWLVPSLGHAWSSRAMAVANVVAAAFMLFVAWRQRRSSASPEQRSEPATQPLLKLPIATALAASSGFLAIAIEVLWTRALSLSLPVTMHVFAVVLAAYLAGIGLGALLLPAMHRRVSAKRLLIGCYLVCAAGCWATPAIFPWLSGAFRTLIENGTITSFSGYITSIGLGAWAAMLCPTLAMGAALPLLIGITGNGKSRARIAGWLYAFNVVAGVLGSLAATYLIMPALGLSYAIAILAAAYLILALVVGAALIRRRKLTVALATVVLTWSALSAAGVHPQISKPIKGAIYHRDDPSATVAIVRHKNQRINTTEAEVLSLVVNNAQGLNRTDPKTVGVLYRLGHLPLLLYGRPKSALLLGFATGATLAAMADRNLGRLDCIEPLSLLFKIADHFKQVNRQAWKQDAVNLVGEDARRYLMREGPIYDVVVSLPQSKRSTAGGALYSLELIQRIKQRLSERGVYVAWLPLWRLAPEQTGIVVRTFLEVFPRAEAWFGSASDERPVIGLVGRKDGHYKVTTKFRDVLAKLVGSSLERSYREVLGPNDMPIRLRALGNAGLRAWAKGKPVNHLERAVIEYSPPRALTDVTAGRNPSATANLRMITQMSGHDPH